MKIVNADDQANYRVKGPFPLANKADQLAVEELYPLPTEEEQSEIVKAIRDILFYASKESQYDARLNWLFRRYLNRPYGNTDAAYINVWYTALVRRGGLSVVSEHFDLCANLGDLSGTMGCFLARRKGVTKEVLASKVETALVEIERLTVLAKDVDMRLVSNVDKSMLSVRARKALIRLSCRHPELKVSDVKEEAIECLRNCGVVTVCELMDWKEMKHRGLKHGLYDMSGNG